MPFVFIHGAMQAGWVWDDTLAAIGRQSGGQARCLTLDIPGCGAKRGVDTSAITFDDLVASMVADLDASGLSDVVLVGHSQAGTVLPRIAEVRPGLLKRLVYIAAVAPPPGHSVLYTNPPGPADSPATPDPAAMGDFLRGLFCNDMGADQASAFMAKLGRDGWPPQSYAETGWCYDHLGGQLGGIPATFIHCLRDATVTPARQDEFAARLRVDTVVRIDAGHQVMNTRPEALAEVLLSLAAGPGET